VPSLQLHVVVVQEPEHGLGGGRGEGWPSETGLAPSTSLTGSMAPASSGSRAPPGSGVVKMIPATVGSADSALSWAAMPSAVACGPRSSTSQPIPALAVAEAIDRTYHALASSSVAVTTDSRGGWCAAASPAAAAAVPALISAASSRPDSTVTG
jgi:hypothetical protein